MSFPSLMRPTRRPARDGAELSAPLVGYAVLGDLGSLSFDRAQGRQDLFAIHALRFSFRNLIHPRFRGFTKLIFRSKVNT